MKCLPFKGVFVKVFLSEGQFFGQHQTIVEQGFRFAMLVLVGVTSRQFVAESNFADKIFLLEEGKILILNKSCLKRQFIN